MPHLPSRFSPYGVRITLVDGHIASDRALATLDALQLCFDGRIALQENLPSVVQVREKVRSITGTSLAGTARAKVTHLNRSHGLGAVLPR